MKFTEIRDKTIRGKICELMSEMFNNPKEGSDRNTARFKYKMESYIIQEIQNACADGHSIGRSSLNDEIVHTFNALQELVKKSEKKE